MTTYIIKPEDNKEKLDFEAEGEEIVISIPLESTSNTFDDNFRMMVSLISGTRLRLDSVNGVTLATDSLQITKPNDLFYLVRLSANNWKAIRADNYVVENTNREVLLNNKVLSSTDPIYQFLFPSGSSRAVVLPNPPFTNDRFVINNINREDIFQLDIKTSEDGPVVVSLGHKTEKYIVEAIYDSEDWQIILF